MEHNALRFRCSKTGQIFFVGFSRSDTSKDFQIVATQKMPDLNFEESQNGVKSSLPVSKTGAEKAKGNIQNESTPTQNIPSPNADLDINIFDFTGWECPYCGHKKTGDFPRFIKCGECGELVCGSKTSLLPDGRKIFSCYSECGHSGEVKGSMKSIKGIEAKQNPALPAPKKLLPP